MSLLKIKLGKDRSLFHPTQRLLMNPDQVYEVPRNQFWGRRLKDGDVIIVKNTASKGTTKKKSEDKNTK